MKGKLIWIILGLAFFLRVVAVVNFPAGFNADEASHGYDAYSILKTGRDQWGNVLPLVLKSFGDYKSPLYAYLSIPFVAVFGLNIFSTRILGVFIGTLSVLATYLLTKKISKSDSAAYLASLFVAINPWSVMLGRGAFESNLVTFLIPFGIYYFLEKKYTLSAIFFGLSLFSYHSAKLITPLMLGYLVFVHLKDDNRLNFKKLLLPMAILVFSFTGLFLSFKSGGGTRITERSIANGALIQGFDERMVALKNGTNPKVAKILHNKYQVTVKRFITNYSQYFSYKFLISRGAGEGSYGLIPGIGVISIAEYICFFGLIPLVLKKREYINKILPGLFFWLLVSPLPGALSSGIGYAGNRASSMLPVLQIISALGVLGYIDLFKNQTFFLKKLATGVFIILITGSFVKFCSTYFISSSNKTLSQSSYGVLDVFDWLNEKENARQVVVSRSLSEPQIFAAFAGKINPYSYQEATKNWDLNSNGVVWVDQLPKYTLGKYTITSIDWKNSYQVDAIVVAKADELPKGLTAAKTFYFPNGEANIIVIDMAGSIYAKK